MINVFNSPIEATALDEFHGDPGTKEEQVFDNTRKRPKVEYHDDGRKKVDGKVCNEQSPNALWTTTISRGVANEWRDKAGGGRLQMARRYASSLWYDCRVAMHRTARSTPALAVLNLALLLTVLYIFKIIVW